MVTCLSVGYDGEGSSLVLSPVEKHLLDGYASSFHIVSHWRHDIHPQQTGISSGICPKRARIMISSSSCFSRINTRVLCDSSGICVYRVEL